MSPVPWNDARQLITSARLLPADRIEWQNEPFQPPEPPDLWLSVEGTSRTLLPIELGDNAWQETGTLYVHVVSPANAGSDAARALAKGVTDTFRNLGPRPVVYTGASIGNGVANDPQGIWWLLTVTLDWRYQDIGV